MQRLVVAPVKVPELSRLERAPPVLVAAIPVHRFPQSTVQRHLRAPTEGAELGGVDGVATIVPEAVTDVLLQRRRLVQRAEHQVGDLEPAGGAAEADVVVLAWDPHPQRSIDACLLYTSP